MEEHQKSAEDIIAAQQTSASAQMHKEAAERARRKAQELIEANS